MSSVQSLRPCVEPCLRKKSHSSGGSWLASSDFGECNTWGSDRQFFPCLIPVYNGRVLDIKSDIIHASLSGISVKHYYGKCYKDMNIGQMEDEEELYYQPDEMFGSELFGSEYGHSPSLASKQDWKPESKSFSEADSNIIKDAGNEEFGDATALLPMCMRQKINYRNSFWNLHRPELCKLTWPQKYVSSATVTEHLHEHFVSHGDLCIDFHDEADRVSMLKRELDDYGRLKVLEPPRILPPDEKSFDFKKETNGNGKPAGPVNPNPKCRGVLPRKIPVVSETRFLQFDDEDDELGAEGKSIHRSKEEFCLTIGKYIRKEPIRKSVEEIEEVHSVYNDEYSPEEEGGAYFFNWFQMQAEESFGERTTDESSIEIEPISIPLVEPCPVLAMDDFCRAVAKADFSDLRCHPDDF